MVGGGGTEYQSMSKKKKRKENIAEHFFDDILSLREQNRKHILSTDILGTNCELVKELRQIIEWFFMTLSNYPITVVPIINNCS